MLALNYFNGTDYEKASMSDEEVQAHFKDFDPESLAFFNPDNQLVFEGDTCYWVLY